MKIRGLELEEDWVLVLPFEGWELSFAKDNDMIAVTLHQDGKPDVWRYLNAADLERLLNQLPE